MCITPMPLANTQLISGTIRSMPKHEQVCQLVFDMRVSCGLFGQRNCCHQGLELMREIR